MTELFFSERQNSVHRKSVPKIPVMILIVKVFSFYSYTAKSLVNLSFAATFSKLCFFVAIARRLFVCR